MVWEFYSQIGCELKITKKQQKNVQILNFLKFIYITSNQYLITNPLWDIVNHCPHRTNQPTFIFVCLRSKKSGNPTFGPTSGANLAPQKTQAPLKMWSYIRSLNLTSHLINILLIKTPIISPH